MFCVVILIRHFVFHHLIAMFFFCFFIFLFLWEIYRDKSIFNETDATNQIMVVNMLKNWNFSYSNHYSIIKFVGI